MGWRLPGNRHRGPSGIATRVGCEPHSRRRLSCGRIECGHGGGRERAPADWAMPTTIPDSPGHL